ncbi:carboxypeptidase regulatory-like domain-containing protein, partial [Candidatus Uhrbacteria bacterium]|nr:carboxypeptidase regulatory-like domain-containing protein [Candidatus Uhrbacteria bacterium]
PPITPEPQPANTPSTDTFTKTTEAVRQSVQRAAELTARVIRENEQTIKLSLTIAVPVVTVANPAVVATFPNIHTLLYHFVSWLLSLFGIRKKRKPWGVVYDAITKEPIALAIVRIFNAERKLVETQVTNADGRFGFLVPEGTYTIEATKPEFIFPSKLMTGGEDGEYTNCYFGRSITIRSLSDLVDVSIPIDPRDPRGEKRRNPLWYTVKRVLKRLALPVLVVGTVLAWLATLVVASTFNVTIFIVYLFFLIYEIIISPRGARPWGTVFDATSSSPVPLAAVSLVETQYNRTLKTRLSDYSGRFNFLPPRGTYKIVVKKEGYHFPVSSEASIRHFRHPYYGETITIKKDKAVINLDIPVQRKS